MSLLDDENILIKNTKHDIDNPFYLLYISFDKEEFVYDVMEELGADKKYYKCEKIRSDKWLLSIQDWNHIGKKGNIGAFTIDKFDNRLIIYFADMRYIIDIDLLSKKYSGRFTFKNIDNMLIYEP